jgi:hypothetical protein
MFLSKKYFEKQQQPHSQPRNQSFKTRTGPAGRPGYGTGPGEGKNRSWPGETRSTRT